MDDEQQLRLDAFRVRLCRCIVAVMMIGGIWISRSWIVTAYFFVVACIFAVVFILGTRDAENS